MVNVVEKVESKTRITIEREHDIEIQSIDESRNKSKRQKEGRSIKAANSINCPED